MKNQTNDTTVLDTTTPLPHGDLFHFILNNLDDTFLLVDKDLRIVITNDCTREKALELFGLELLPGTPVLDMAPPDRHEYLRGIYTSVFEGQIRRTETDLVRNGHPVFLEHHFRPAKNNAGEIIGAIVVSRNITESKKAEIALKEVEERWRFALEGSNQGVWDWNLQANTIFYSEGYKRLYGYADGEIGNSINDWKDKIHPEDRERIEREVERHLSGTEPYQESTYRIMHSDGSYKWILAKGMVLSRDARGKALRMIGTHTDITTQVVAEEKIKFSEQQYKNLFELNPLPCWIYDVETLNFLEVNTAALHHYGYSKKEFLSKNLFDINLESNHEKLRERLKKERTKKNIAYNNWQHRRKNGEVIFVDLRINTINYKGREAKLVVTHDVTSKVEVENELRKSNERFSIATKATSEALWEWDVEAEQFYISETYTEIFGWTTNEHNKFDEWHDYIHPDDREAVIGEFYAAVEDRHTERWAKEYRYLTSGGSYAFVLDKAIILRDQQGKATKVIGAIKDVSSQKKAEDDLKKSNERFQFVLRATSDAIYDWDILANDLHWGEGLQTLFGFHPKEVPIELWENLIHPEDRPRVHHSFFSSLEESGKNSWKEEYRFARADGRFSHVLDRGFMIRNESGEAIRVIGSMQDITERKYNEELLSLESSIYELSTNPKLEFHHIVKALLKGIEDIHDDGYTSVVLLREDETMESFIGPRIPPEYAQTLNGIRIGPNVGSCGTSMYNRQTVIVADIQSDPLWKDHQDTAKKFGWKACWSMPIIHSTGKVLGCFAIYYKETKSPSQNEWNTLERVRNILRVLMEHYWSLKEIREVNERFDIMMKATHDLIWDWNLENNMIYRDPAGLKKVYGIEDNAAIETASQWLERIHPEDKKRAEKIIKNVLQARSQGSFELEYRFRKDDGHYSHVYDRGMLIQNAEGKPVRMIGAAQDITERKRLEQQLLKNELERQKAINQATVDTQEKERSEIGKELHDNVNQVLTTTKLYLDLAMSNNELKDELIQKSTRNILSVINEIRQLSRSLMDPSIGDLGLIDSVNDLIENINLTRKLHVRLTADKKIESSLSKTHKLTVFRIIQEALNNAIRHAKATTVHIYISVAKKAIQLTIQDDGIGFHPELVKKGAGLKNIQNRIYLIDGTHTIESKPGQGCKITISFPIINKK